MHCFILCMWKEGGSSKQFTYRWKFRGQNHEAEDTDEIQEINSQAAYASESERQEDIEVNEKDRNLADDSDLIEKIN